MFEIDEQQVRAAYILLGISVVFAGAFWLFGWAGPVLIVFAALSLAMLVCVYQLVLLGVQAWDDWRENRD